MQRVAASMQVAGVEAGAGAGAAAAVEATAAAVAVVAQRTVAVVGIVTVNIGVAAEIADAAAVETRAEPSEPLARGSSSSVHASSADAGGPSMTAKVTVATLPKTRLTVLT